MKYTTMSILLLGNFIYGQANDKLAAALNEIFPHGFLEETIILSVEKKASIEAQSRARLNSQIVTIYHGNNNRYAIFVNSIIRTHPIVFFGVISAKGKIEEINIVAFLEPRDYFPPDSWLNLLHGISSADQLYPGSSIVNITGATLTTQTITRELRKMLILLYSQGMIK